MKKLIIFIILIIFICFLIPVIFTKKFDTLQTFSETKKIEIYISHNYEDYNKIRLLHTNTNEIDEVNLDEYLCNVVAAEMPASYNQEALKAQAVVARTYTIYTIAVNKGKHEGADICDSFECCQAWISKEDRFAKWDESVREEYWNKITTAVNETIGEVVTFDGELINALYHSNSGGKTEIASMVWGGNDYPYLQSVETLRRRRI